MFIFYTGYLSVLRENSTRKGANLYKLPFMHVAIKKNVCEARREKY
jgi:hypothetical protein